MSDNSAPDGGGLSVGSWAGVTLKNSTITNNAATTGNGGACYANGGGFNVANSIIWGNRATSGTGHIAYMASSGIIYVNIYDSIIENNGDNNIYDDGYYYTPSPTYVRFSSDYIKGNYDSDPNFVNPHADGDYHVNDPSDAIDNAANNSGWGIPSEDLEGNSRPSGSEDIGVYEYQDGVSVSFTSSSQTTAGESGTATITVELSEAGNKDVTVPFTVTGDSTATGGGTDYSITASPITITAGDTTASISVTLASDSLDEDDETVIVDMGTPAGASQGATTSHTITITDDDDPPTVTFTSASQATADESGTATITAQLSAVSALDVTVPFTVNGLSTADDPDDYSITTSPLTITAGNTSADITITVAADTDVENDETVIMDMGSPTNATQGAITSHTLTITDDEVGNHSPVTPTNSSPANGATGVSRTPTLTASAYSDPDSDPHQASQWQISTDSSANFDANIVYDSGAITNLVSHTVSTTLSFGTTYYWHVRYQDNQGNWSSYSTETFFITPGGLSCTDILNSGKSTGDGNYWIDPDDSGSNPGVEVYCDMTGGGWTRLNNSIATSSTAFNGSDVLITNNVPGNASCNNPPGSAFTISNIQVPHTDVKIHLTRTTSVCQCASLEGVSPLSTAYWDGSTWVSNSTCTWGDGIWANGCGACNPNDMTGLKTLWKLEGAKATSGNIKFTSQCTGSNDNGQIQVTGWVK